MGWSNKSSFIVYIYYSDGYYNRDCGSKELLRAAAHV